VIYVDIAGIVALFAVDLVLFVLLPRRQADGWCAVAAGVLAAAYGLLGCVFLNRYCTAYCAVSAWAWWRHGGGDGTKRRLRALAARFRGVRRTAPSLGGVS
jgi:hypothetical protein